MAAAVVARRWLCTCVCVCDCETKKRGEVQTVECAATHSDWIVCAAALCVLQLRAAAAAAAVAEVLLVVA